VDVPDLIRAVASADEPTRQQAWHHLYDKVMKEFALPTNVTRLQAFLDGCPTPDDKDWSTAILPPTKAGIELVARLRSQVEKSIQANPSLRSGDEGDEKK
jgi:hypothetical protein